MKDYYVDLHCHPSIKPYGKSFKNDSAGIQSSNPADANSLWNLNPPSLVDKLVEFITSLPKFSQSNAQALSKGNVYVSCASLYPLEKKLFNNLVGTGVVSDVLDNFVTCVGESRINFIQNITDYFSDLENEYDFYKQLDGTVININGENFRYVLVKNFAELAFHLSEETTVNTICIIVTIEGMHVLNTGLNLSAEPDETEVLDNIIKIKKWQHRPPFVTFAHHFYNQLCGHSRSLTENFINWATDQEDHLNAPFTNLGEKVRDALLNKTDGRILIDIKHMSATARNQYFNFLEAVRQQTGEIIPVIVSHGAANGRRSMQEKNVVDITETGFNLFAQEINFYDDEIINVAKSNGIFGLQLDERRIASHDYIKHQVRHAIARNKIMHYRSYLLWQQVQHIAELLDSKGMFAWDVLSIGSDYDGIIDTLNAFWTEKEMPFLADFFERHANNYMLNRGVKVLKSFNQLNADEVTSRIFRDNAMRFLKTNFN